MRHTPPLTTQPLNHFTTLRYNHAMDTRILRILDASANRAREALRVLEDCARFAKDDQTPRRHPAYDLPEGTKHRQRLLL